MKRKKKKPWKFVDIFALISRIYLFREFEIYTEKWNSEGKKLESLLTFLLSKANLASISRIYQQNWKGQSGKVCKTNAR